MPRIMRYESDSVMTGAGNSEEGCYIIIILGSLPYLCGYIPSDAMVYCVELFYEIPGGRTDGYQKGKKSWKEGLELYY